MGHSVASQGSENFCSGCTPGPWAFRTRESQNSPALTSHSCISSFIYSSIQQACIEPYTSLGKGLRPENTIGTKDSHFQWENADCVICAMMELALAAWETLAQHGWSEEEQQSLENFLEEEMPKQEPGKQGKSILHRGNSMCKGHKGRGISHQHS